MTNYARLAISCPDQAGLVAAVSGYLYQSGANLLALDQHVTGEDGEHFYMRAEFELKDQASLAQLSQDFGPSVAEKYAMQWRLSDSTYKPKVAIFASTTDHCLLELLWRWQRGELPCEVGVVISNHETLRPSVERFGVRFEHIPVTADNKAQAEQAQLELLEGYDLAVLARYMQILSPQMVAAMPNRIINIHHSFLPAFAGARPYHQAWQRGVKLIGATAHYVTDELDEGPIIQQSVAPVSHRHSADDLRQLGQELERQSLFQAVRWHLEDRIMVHNGRTVVFA